MASLSIYNGRSNDTIYAVEQKHDAGRLTDFKIVIAILSHYEFLNVITFVLCIVVLFSFLILLSLVGYIHCKNLRNSAENKLLVYRVSYTIISVLALLLVCVFAFYATQPKGDATFQLCLLSICFILFVISLSVITRLFVYIRLRKVGPEIRDIRFSLMAARKKQHDFRDVQPATSQPTMTTRQMSDTSSKSTPNLFSSYTLASLDGRLSSNHYMDIQEVEAQTLSHVSTDDLSIVPVTSTTPQNTSKLATLPAYIAQSSSAQRGVISDTKEHNRTSYLTLYDYGSSNATYEGRNYLEPCKYEELSVHSPLPKSKSPSQNPTTSPGVECALRLDQKSHLAEFKLILSTEALNVMCNQMTK